MRAWIHDTVGRHVRQAQVGLGDLREQHIRRQGFFGPLVLVHVPGDRVRGDHLGAADLVADPNAAELTRPRTEQRARDICGEWACQMTKRCSVSATSYASGLPQATFGSPSTPPRLWPMRTSRWMRSSRRSPLAMFLSITPSIVAEPAA